MAELVPSQKNYGCQTHAGLLRARGVPAMSCSTIRNWISPKHETDDECLDANVLPAAVRERERS